MPLAPGSAEPVFQKRGIHEFSPNVQNINDFLAKIVESPRLISMNGKRRIAISKRFVEIDHALLNDDLNA